MKQLWMLVGGNGAGKSTFYEQMLKPKGMPFINADIIAQKMFPEDPETNSRKAADVAETLRLEKLREGKSFCFETVFSHPSKIDFIAQAKTLNYQVILVFIHVEHDEINIARVAQRVIEGGHSVPTDKIRSRIPRTLDNVRKAIPLCDHVYVLDNSHYESDSYRRIMDIRAGEMTSYGDLPLWASHLVAAI